MLIIAVASIVMLTALVIKRSKKKRKISEAIVIFNFENTNRSDEIKKLGQSQD